MSTGEDSFVSLQLIPLRKLLTLIFSEPARRRSDIRSDIRADIRRASGTSERSGNFQTVFWADAKRHVLEIADLHDSVAQRIAGGSRNARHYQLLRDGFLLWFNERRRWTNRPFQQGPSRSGRFVFPGLDAIIKVDGILSARDAEGVEHHVYPYFSEDPALSEEAARLGLWVLCSVLENVPAEEIRILDVMRGRTFSVDRLPLTGNEETEFRRRYSALLNERDVLLRDYD